MDAVELARELIACPSITPADAGALSIMARQLSALGFDCHDLTFQAPGTEAVRNLFAIRGKDGRHFCFAGHTDVVPTGDLAAWSDDPFAATVKDGWLIGRGSADMKGAIAAFTAAAAAMPRDHRGRISLLLTGDEEGAAINGTAKVLNWMRERNLVPDLCLVGEPTCVDELGDMIKIGRRGSLSGVLSVTGQQGHVAYPHLADNPIPRLIALAAALEAIALDSGTEWFQPSNLEITSIDVGNSATNVIPARGTLRFNIRFNSTYRSQALMALIRSALAATGHAFELEFQVSGEAFFTEPGALSDLVSNSVVAVTGRKPELSTTGGTSDARFIRDYCPVVEFGLVGKSMHKVDERTRIADVIALTKIYAEIIAKSL